VHEGKGGEEEEGRDEGGAEGEAPCLGEAKVRVPEGHGVAEPVSLLSVPG
jgi:hypothetical protein